MNYSFLLFIPSLADIGIDVYLNVSDNDNVDVSRFVATLTFNNATDRMLCVGVVAIDDDRAESTIETALLTLTAVNSADSIGINSTVINIMDNDGEREGGRG